MKEEKEETKEVKEEVKEVKTKSKNKCNRFDTIGLISCLISVIFIVLGLLIYISRASNIVGLACLVIGLIMLIIIGAYVTVAMIAYLDIKVENIKKSTDEKSEDDTKEDGNAKLEEKKEREPLKISISEMIYYILTLVALIGLITFLLCGVYFNNYTIAIIYQLITIAIFDFIILNVSTDKEIKSMRLIYVYSVINVFYFVTLQMLSTGCLQGKCVMLDIKTIILEVVDFLAIFAVYPFYIRNIKKILRGNNDGK